MKNPNKKILFSLSIACLLGLFAYLSPTLAKVINFGTGSDTSYFPGNIGVGATTTDKLNVSGTLRVTGTTTLAAYTGQGNQCLYVDNGGIVRMLGSQCGSATGGDNLGNHTATQNLNLAANALVGNGGSTGITISSGGAVSIANGLTLTTGTLSLPNNAVTDAMVSDTLTASNLVAGSAVVSDAEVDNNITVTSGTIGSNNVSSASTWTTLGTLTIGDNGDAVLMSATNWDVDSSGNIFANGGFSTYDTTVTDNYIEAGGFCMGNGTNCITSWTNAGGNVNASSPTVNYVTKFSDSDTIANSTIFDNGSGVGIGTTTVSSARLVVNSGSTYSIDAGGKPMINVGVSADPTASVNRNYVDSAVAGVSGGGGYWSTTGDTIYASTTMTSVGIGTTSPTAPFEVYGGFYMGGGSGDVDNNGYVNSTDALIAAQFAHNLTTLTPLQQAMADVDGDGMVTDFDAKNIMKRFVNIYSSRNQMNAESRRLKATGLNYDGNGQVMVGYNDYSNEVYMRDKFTVFGTSLMDTTATSTFNPSNSTSSALMLTGPYGGGLIFKDTAYGGLWMSDSGQTLNFASNGSGNGFGSTYGQMVLKNGKVGIGFTNPSYTLEVNGDIAIGTSSAIRSTSNGGKIFQVIGTNVAVGDSALASLTNGAGNVAVGSGVLGTLTSGGLNIALGLDAGLSLADGYSANTSPTNSIYIGYNTKAAAASDANEIVIGHNATGAGSNSVVLGSSAVTKTILRANVGIGTTNPTRPLHVVGNVQVDSGSVTADAFYYNSDRTLKKDIRPIPGALAKVLNLQGVAFKWRDSGEANYGFIAQDVEKVLPELVETGIDGKKSVAYGNFTAILVEALKTQQKEIDSLQARVKSLESSLK